MVQYFKGGVRDLAPDQIEALVDVLFGKRCSPSREASRLGYGDNLDSGDLEGQLLAVGYEMCPNCYVWVRTSDLINDSGCAFFCPHCVER